MNDISKGYLFYLTKKPESSSMITLLFFAHVRYMHNSSLCISDNYPILKGGHFYGLKCKEKDSKRFNSMRLERENCDQATPVLYPAEVTLRDCLLVSFALHFCKPISDAKRKRSSDFDLLRKGTTNNCLH